MPEHHLRPTLSGQWARPNIVGSHWHKRCILQESCINNLDHRKLRTTCSPGWLQCQSGCRQRLVALLPHQRSAVCWRRSNCNSHPERIAVADETLLSRTLSRLSACRRQNNVMGQDMQSPPAITINDYKLDSDHQFVYLGSTITNNLSLDTEINKRVRKAATTLTRPTSHVWSNLKLTVKTKMGVYNACILSTLHVLHGSETWTTYMYARQQKGLSSFHLRSICCILGISCKTKWPTLKSCLVLAFPPCTPYWDNARCTG